LRGVPSYGFVAKVPSDLAYTVGGDVSSYYKAWKYEPPVRVQHGGGGLGEPLGLMAKCPDTFHEYTDIQPYWKHHKVIEAGTPVVVSEKCHGTNTRVALLKVDDEWGFYAGSHHRARREFDNVGRLSAYWKPLEDASVLHLLTELCDEQNNVIVFGELFGAGVQDLDYGQPQGDPGFRVFDISVNGRYLDWAEMIPVCLGCGVRTVPILYSGPFDPERVEEWTNGPTLICPPEQITHSFKGREGCVIKPTTEQWDNRLGRVILKSVSADYRKRKNAQDNGEL
jgi:RNA ligase (TIGR02306 family)